MSDERYKPTVNINQAPQLLAPSLYIGTAYVFLCIVAALMLADAQRVANGEYASPLVIMLVHFFTLGFLSMTAMGILHQWIPVVFDVPAYGPRWVISHFTLYVVGVLGFAGGLADRQWPLLAISGSLLSLMIVLGSVGVFRQLSRSPKPHDAVYRGIQASVVSFNVVWMLGLFMVLSFLGWWSSYQVVQVHVATALVGWMGILILTVQQKLNPMFAMSKADGIHQGMPLYWAIGGVILAWVSLFSSPFLLRIAAFFWVMSLVVMGVNLMRILRQRKTPVGDSVFVGVGVAWGLLFGSAMMAFWLSPFAVILAFWGMLTLIFSYQARIVPFIVAVAIARRIPGPVYKAFFMAQAMHSKKLPVVAGILGVVGAGGTILGRLTLDANWVTFAGIILLVLIAMQVVGLGRAMIKGQANRGVPLR